MPDREKVIKGLECCIETSEMCWDNPKCPYSGCGDSVCGEDCMSIMMRDTLALLKAQEPRVMTVEEVVGCVILGRNITLWFEFRSEVKEMNARDIVYNDYLCDLDFPTLNDPNLEWEDRGKRDGVIIEEYNDTFRCWTSRPTDEQREAVPWN